MPASCCWCSPLHWAAYRDDLETAGLLLRAWAAGHLAKNERSRELLRRPAWVVEYINRCKPANARELLAGARDRCSNAWLLPWLDLYISRGQ